ncbi:MAG: heme-binding protein, partial [Desulfuromonadales bacterium]|nr:heme-binding protein [Desulfuromonadales bacterium]NIS39449.1 heme-binding protein [Desulfuromonadales bacterium]
RYSGTWSEDLYRENEKILLEAIEAAGLKAIGEPIFARYNAPFSLWFMRRNEVLVEVEAP